MELLLLQLQTNPQVTLQLGRPAPAAGSPLAADQAGDQA